MQYDGLHGILNLSAVSRYGVKNTSLDSLTL